MNTLRASFVMFALAACEKDVSYVEATPVMDVTATDASSITSGPED